MHAQAATEQRRSDTQKNGKKAEEVRCVRESKRNRPMRREHLALDREEKKKKVCCFLDLFFFFFRFLPSNYSSPTSSTQSSVYAPPPTFQPGQHHRPLSSLRPLLHHCQSHCTEHTKIQRKTRAKKSAFSFPLPPLSLFSPLAKKKRLTQRKPPGLARGEQQLPPHLLGAPVRGKLEQVHARRRGGQAARGCGGRR